MKTAFKILPEEVLENNCHLLIEVGWEGISFLYYSKNPFKIEGLLIYQFEKNITAIDLANELSVFFEEENLPSYLTANICYNFKEYSLIPTLLYKADLQEEILNSIHAVNNNSAVFAEKLSNPELTLSYRVDHNILEVLNMQFPSAINNHTLVLQMPMFYKNADFFYCIVYQNSIKVVLFINHTLQITRFFDYNTPADVAYHLLNVCKQHHKSPKEITLTLAGFIDKKSNLYDDLYRYFLNIELQELSEDVTTTNAVAQYPDHFFSHLIQMGKCVS